MVERSLCANSELSVYAFPDCCSARPFRRHSPPTVERIKFKKEKKEKKPKHKSFATFGEWISGGEESSASSSDESNKKFTTRMGSSSNTYFMTKGMEDDVKVMMTPNLLQLMIFLT